MRVVFVRSLSMIALVVSERLLLLEPGDKVPGKRCTPPLTDLPAGIVVSRLPLSITSNICIVKCEENFTISVSFSRLCLELELVHHPCLLYYEVILCTAGRLWADGGGNERKHGLSFPV